MCPRSRHQSVNAPIVATGLANWLSSLSPQVEAALIAASATCVGIVSTAVVGLVGFRSTRRAGERALVGQHQRDIAEREFAVYEDAIKYLLRLDRIRPANYNVWPERTGRSASARITDEEHADIQARLAAWAVGTVRDRWNEMIGADNETDVARTNYRFLTGTGPLKPAEPQPPETIEGALELVCSKANRAANLRLELIGAIREELRKPPQVR